MMRDEGKHMDDFKTIKTKIEKLMAQGKLKIVNDGSHCYHLFPLYDPHRPQVRRQIMKPVAAAEPDKSTKL